MNHKFYIHFFVLTIVLCSKPLIARNPLDVLGLDEDATETDIKKQCRKLQAQFHTDKGGDNTKSTEINNACDDLDWRSKDDCKINSKPLFASCDCLTGTRKTSFCTQGFTDSSIRCDCLLSDGSNQSDSSNQFQGHTSKKSKTNTSSSSNQQSSSSSNNTYNNHDGCFFEKQPCSCSNTGQSGTCNYGPIKTGLYCQCPQQNQQSTSSNSNTNKSSQQPPVQDECEKPGYGFGSTCTCSNTGNKGTCEHNWTTHKYECKCSNDECENNSSNGGKKCTCPNGNKGTCNYDFSDDIERCQCSDDECENNNANWGKPCHCSDSGKEGTCQFGRMKNNKLGYRCECEDQQTRSSYSTNNGTPETPSFTPDSVKTYAVPVYSLNIAAPIYNLPLKRTMSPTTECSGWWFSATPYAQTNWANIETIEPLLHDITVKNTEGGFLFNIGYYGSHWYIYDTFSLAGSTISSTSLTDMSMIEHGTRIGTLDGLLGLGFKTDNSEDDTWKLSLEGFFGVTEQRTKNIHEQAPINIFPDLGTGLQAHFDYVFSSDYASKYELITLSRFTYFIPVEGEMQSTQSHEKIGSIRYSSGAFLDIFVGLKQYYGFDYQHHIECGYNPTIHVMSASTNSKCDAEKSTLMIFDATIPSVRHTFYANYTYNWNTGKIPMNFSVGGSATCASRMKPYGTFFATYSLGF
jgi:hypothetical protein